MNSEELRNSFSALSVLVCGDMCLDKNYIGGYSGYSRELEHLPIFRTEREIYSPGGGGNLCSCFSELGVRTIAAGVWGSDDDFNRYILETEFRKRGIDTSGMVSGSRTPTFGKVYLRNSSHIYRLDLVSESVPESSINKLIDRISCAIKSVDFIACADYEEASEYGSCSENALELIGMSKIPKFGTSRARIKRFKNFNHILLNTKELIDQTRLDKSTDMQLVIEDFIGLLGVNEIIITMGGKGASAFRLDGYLPAKLKETHVSSIELTENIDPCGCGDMFYAAYASSIMAGYDTETSLGIANAAARVVSRKLFGTGQANPEEVAQEYELLYRN